MASKKFNFKMPFTDPDGEILKDGGKQVDMNELLSNNMMSSSINETGFVMKFFNWAIDLKKEGVLILDEADKKKISDWIETNPQLTLLSKGRLMNILENGEEIDKKTGHKG